MEDKLTISTKWEDRFVLSVITSWEDVSLNLVKRSPKTKAEICRQPLIWKSISLTIEDMLGVHTQCVWAELDWGPAQYIRAWTKFPSTSIDQRVDIRPHKKLGKLWI